MRCRRVRRVPASLGLMSNPVARAAPPRPVARPSASPALLLAALALAGSLAGCRLAASEPSPTPASFPGITRVLGVAGITTGSIVAGDPGCPDPALSKTAIAFTAVGLDQPTPVPLHLYRFADDEALGRNLSAIAACAATFVTDPEQYVQLVASPYVVVGEGPWGAAFTETLTKGLEAAASSGG